MSVASTFAKTASAYVPLYMAPAVTPQVRNISLHKICHTSKHVTSSCCMYVCMHACMHSLTELKLCQANLCRYTLHLMANQQSCVMHAMPYALHADTDPALMLLVNNNDVQCIFGTVLHCNGGTTAQP